MNEKFETVGREPGRKALSAERRNRSYGLGTTRVAITGGIYDLHLIGEAGQRFDYAIYLAGGLKVFQPSERCHDPLPRPAVLPAILDKLKIAATPGAFDSCKHDTMTIGNISCFVKQKLRIDRADSAPCWGVLRTAGDAISMGYSRHPSSNCRS